MSRFRGPVRRARGGYVVHLSHDESAILRRLLGELEELLRAEPGDDQPGAALLQRLFPPAHLDDPEREAEYQRLMREELVASRLEALRTVDRMLADGGPLTEEQLTAFMQSINAVRLVLGVMLEVSDDPDQPEVAPAFERSPEHQLYGYLSWLLECSVQALAGQT